MAEENGAVKTRRIIDDEAVRAEARKSGLPEEEVLLGLMKRSPVLYGALSDWHEIGQITFSAIRELKSFASFQEIYDLVMRVITLYDTQVISVLRTFSDVKRLAYFVNEMIESMLEVNAYQAALIRQYKLCVSSRMVLRGIVLKRIADEDVMNIFMSSGFAFFRAENFCASRFLAEGSIFAANDPSAALSN